MAWADFDLLGDPVPEGFGSRGRPPHVATEYNRQKTLLCLAQGWSPKRIADVFGITMPTLRKYYFRELRQRDVALDRVEAGTLTQLWVEGQKGNVAALKEVARYTDRARAARFGALVDPDEPAPKPVQLGKKEAMNIAAETAGAGSEWGSDLLTPTAH